MKFFTFALLCFLGATAARGQSASAPLPPPQDSRPIVIQMAPAAEVSRFLTNERPVRRKEFEEFLQRRGEGEANAASPSGIQIPVARYHAKLTGDGVLAGKARVEFINPTGALQLIPTPGLSAAIENAKWKDKSDPVYWGIGPDQRMVLVVPQSGELEFDWSLRIIKPSQQRADVDLEFFQATRTEFELESPGVWTPIINGRSPQSTKADDADLVRHAFALGSARRLALRMEKVASPNSTRSPCTITQTARVDLGRQGIDLVADLEVNPHDAPLSQLPLRIDGPLEIVSATLGQSRLGWTKTVKEDGSYIAQLRFDPPLAESGRKIRLECRAPITFDQLAPLPLVRSLDASWQESELELYAAAPLEFSGIEMVDAKLSDSGPLAAARGGESRRIRLYSPSASVRCAVSIPKFQSHVRYAAAVAVNESAFELAARMRISAGAGETFDLSSEIPLGWVVDSVESTVAGQIESWTVAPGAAQQKLSIQLSRAIAPKTPIELRLQAHLPRVNLAPLPASTFLLAHFADAALDAAYLRLTGAPGMKVEAAQADARRVDLSADAPTDANLFPAESSGPAYRLGASPDFLISHAAAAPEYRLSIASRVFVEPSTVRSLHRFMLTPSRQSLDRITLRATPPGGGEMMFRMADASQQRITATKRESDAQGDLWELRFAEPVAAAAEFIAEERMGVAEVTPLCVWRSDAANSLESRLQIFVQDGDAWEVKGLGARPLSVGSSEAAGYTELAAYRFAASDPASITLMRADASRAAPRIWALREKRTTIVGDESPIHESTFDLECRSDAEAVFDLPPEAKIASIQLNGELIQAYQVSERRLRIPAAAKADRQTLQVRIAIENSPRENASRRIAWQGALAQFPVVAQHWTIWSPPHLFVDPQSQTHSLWNAFSLVRRDSHQAIASDEENLTLQVAGWRSTRIGAPSGDAANIIAYSADAWRMAGWCVLVLMLAIVAGFDRFVPAPRLVALLSIVALAVGAIFTPSPYALLLSGAFLGAIIGFLIRELRLQRVPSPEPSRRLILAAKPATFLLVISLIANQTSLAQPPKAAPEATSSKPRRNVIDPVDADGKPVGEFVYVSPELFEEMALASPTLQAEPSLLTEARYRIGRVSGEAASALPMIAEFTYFTGSDSQIAILPLDPRRDAIRGDEIWVDGERRTLAKVREDRPPQFEIQGRGAHTVRVELALPLRGENGGSLIKWKAPQLVKQSLEIETDASTVWLLGGEPIKHDSMTRLAAIRVTPGMEMELGLRPAAEEEGPQAATFRHDVWLTIETNTISAEHLVRIAAESPASHLEFDLDESAEIQSITDGALRAIAPLRLGERRWRVPLTSPPDEDAEVRIKCVMKTGLGAGRIATTGLSFPAAKSATHVGVTASADYQLQTEKRAGVSDLPLGEFLSAWPASRNPPQIALAVDAGKTWGVEIRSRPSQLSARVRQELLVHAKEIEVDFDADVFSSGDSISIYALRVPAAFVVESVSVVEGAASRVVRFARTRPDLLTLFLRIASAELRRIKLRGRIPFDQAANPSASAPIPSIAFEQAVVTSHSIRIFRGYDARVEMGPLKGLRSIDLAQTEQAALSVIEPQKSRLIGVYEAATAQPWEGGLKITPNQPRLTHESIARFETREGKWRLSQSLAIEPADGLVDELEVELPASLREPLKIEPSQPSRIVRTEGSPPRLVITPAQAWSEAQTLEISGDYQPDSSAAEMKFEPMLLLGSSADQSLLAAAKRSSAGEYAWQGENTDEGAAPADFAAAAEFRWFKLKSPPSFVRLTKSTEQKSLSWRLDGEVLLSADAFTATLRWFWNGAADREFILHAPQSVEIIHAKMRGAGAQLSRIDDRRWKISLAAGAAPAALEVICKGPFRDRAPLPLPALEGAPPLSSVLSVRHAQEIEPASKDHALLTSRESAQLARLRILDFWRRESQLELSSLGQEETLAWERNWLALWTAARGAIGADKPAAPGAAPPWLKEADVDAARMQTQQATTSAASASDAATPLPLFPGDAASETFSYFTSENAPLLPEFERRSASSLALRRAQTIVNDFPWLLAPAALALMLAVAMLTSRARRALFGRILPIAAWIALALLWYAWATPSWFGPTLSAAALLAAAAGRIRGYFAVKRNWSSAI